jgi:serine protease Do
MYLLSMSLPTPEGYAAVIVPVPGIAKDALVEVQQMLTDFTYVTFEAPLARWREYLPLKASQPKVFSSLKIDIDADYKKLHFGSRRMDLDITPDVLPLTPTTVLAVNFSFYRDGSAVVWDVGSLLVGENAQKNEFVEVRRHVQPGPDLPDSFQSTWKKLTAAEFPYNGVAVDDKGGMRDAMVVAPPGADSGPGIRYALTVRNEGAPGQDAMHTQLEALHKAFKDLEH